MSNRGLELQLHFYILDPLQRADDHRIVLVFKPNKLLEHAIGFAGDWFSGFTELHKYVS